MRRKQIRKAPTYHARLFTDEQEAEDWLTRMRLKMGTDYTFECNWNDQYELYHVRLWDTRDGEGYIK